MWQWWPRKLPDGDTVPDLARFSSTSSANEEYVIRNDKLYYPVTRFPSNSFSDPPQDWGLGCFDLTTHTECGYVRLSTNPNARDYRVAIEGPFVIGDKFYLLDLEMNLHCLEFPTKGAILPVSCLTTPSIGLSVTLPIYTADQSKAPGHIGGEVGPTGSIFANNLYLTVNYHGATGATISPPTPRGKQAICINTVLMTTCNGWAGASTFGFGLVDRQDNYSNFIQYDTLSNPVNLCVVGLGSRATLEIPSCLSLTTGAAVTDVLFDAAVASQPQNISKLGFGFGFGFLFGFGGEVTIANRTYFPIWASGKIFCYDWATQAACPGIISPTLNDGSSPEDYALSVDGAGCISVNFNRVVA